MQYVCGNCGHSMRYGVDDLEIECEECGGTGYGENK